MFFTQCNANTIGTQLTVLIAGVILFGGSFVAQLDTSILIYFRGVHI